MNRRGGEARKRLPAQSVTLIAEQGPAALSLREVGWWVGVRQQYPYLQVGSRSRLLAKRLLGLSTHMRLWAAAMFSVVLVSHPAAANPHAGRYLERGWPEMASSRVASLDRRSINAIRVSWTDSRCCQGWIVEIHATRRGDAEFTALFQQPSGRHGWIRTGWFRSFLRGSEYTDLIAATDAALNRHAPPSDPEQVCLMADGPGIVVERHTTKGDEWYDNLSDGCGAAPVGRVAELVLKAVSRSAPMEQARQSAKDYVSAFEGGGQTSSEGGDVAPR